MPCFGSCLQHLIDVGLRKVTQVNIQRERVAGFWDLNAHARPHPLRRKHQLWHPPSSIDWPRDASHPKRHFRHRVAGGLGVAMVGFKIPPVITLKRHVPAHTTIGIGVGQTDRDFSIHRSVFLHRKRGEELWTNIP